MKARALLVAVIAASLIVPHVGIVAADLTGGGEVTNTAPVVDSITVTPTDDAGTETGYQTSGGSPTTELNDDTDDYVEVTVVVYDANGEDDMTYLNMSLTGGNTLEDGTAWFTHQIVAGDKDAGDPGFQENTIAGYDNGTADNGYLTFKFKHTFDHGDDPANGALTSSTYTWQAEIKDSAGSTATDTSAVDVYNYADLSLEQGYYNSTGGNVTAVSGAVWGNWSGSTGTTQTGTTYIKATNAGSTGTGNLSISWNGVNLTNATNSGNIPLTNLEYYEGEAADPASVASWTHLDANATHMKSWAAVTHSTGGTTTSWSNYTISIPVAVPQGNYSQTFTWTIT